MPLVQASMVKPLSKDTTHKTKKVTERFHYKIYAKRLVFKKTKKI